MDPVVKNRSVFDSRVFFQGHALLDSGSIMLVVIPIRVRSMSVCKMPSAVAPFNPDRMGQLDPVVKKRGRFVRFECFQGACLTRFGAPECWP